MAVPKIANSAYALLNAGLAYEQSISPAVQKFFSILEYFAF